MPNLVGPNETYKNLRGYLNHQHNWVQNQFKEVNLKLHHSGLDAKRDTNEVYMHIRNEIGSLEKRSLEVVKDLEKQLQTDFEDKITSKHFVLICIELKRVDTTLQAEQQALNGRINNLLDQLTSLTLEHKETRETCKRGTAKMEHLIKAIEVSIENRVKKDLDDFKHHRMSNAAA